MLLKQVNNVCVQDKKRKENVLPGVPYPPTVIHYLPFQDVASVVVYSNCHCSSALYLSLCFILFKIVWWPSAGTELFSWLSACDILNCLFDYLLIPTTKRKLQQIERVSERQKTIFLLAVN